MPKNSLGREMIAEFIGTWILVFLGVGVVHTITLCGAQSGLWQVAVVWGLAIALAIYAVGAVSGAHLNPAVTVAFSVFGNLPWKKTAPYIVAQLAGAIVAAVMLYMLFSGAIADYEKKNNIVRGEPASVITASCYGEYFPNPGQKWEPEVVPMSTAMLAEMIGTGFLMFMILALTDGSRKDDHFMSKITPIFIGLTVAVMISVLAPLTQACFNPARDFGPRIVAYFAGWGSIAFPGPNGGLLQVYLISPILGALIGGCIYKFLVQAKEQNEG